MEEIYKKITEILHNGDRAVLATIIARKGSIPAPIGAKMLVLSDGSILGTVGGGSVEGEVHQIAEESIGQNRPKIVSFDLKNDDLVCGGSMDVLIEPIAPTEKLYIFGAGHIAQPLSKMAVMTGFKVIIIDDRDKYANHERFPEASEIIVSDFENSFQKLDINDNSFVVIVTRGHAFDELVLEYICQTNAKYIGMIGSKNKVKHIFDALRQKSIDEKKLEIVHAPIGLAIGAETPAEIAVSILSEMIKIRHNE